MKKSLTLIEVLLSLLIVTLAIGAVFLVYPTVFEGVIISSEKVKAWEETRRQLEVLKNSRFSKLYAVSYDPQNDDPVVKVFPVFGITDSSGVYYIEKMYVDTDNDGVFNETAEDLLKIEVIISFKAGRRTLGEDNNFNGILDPGEDQNQDNKISSPVSLHTLVLEQR
ncbi:type II secretion system protein J [Candidatus Omnitrophota bacterium]